MNTENAVKCQFGNAIKELNICRLLRASNIWKKGGSVFDIFHSLTKPDRVVPLVLDDPVIPGERSKKVELLTCVYDHVANRTVKGFNMLTLGWTDGYSFVPVSFNMMASSDVGKRVMPASESIDRRKAGHKCRQDAILHKP